jgi:ubiquinone/menaquinone biosynthesis C-methylase UbiE
VLWWTERFGTHVEGTDPDPVAIDQADKAARATGFQRLATFQVTEATNLPHEEQVFDVVVVNFTSLGGGDGSKIMSEAGRVARPMATVMALVPTWLSSPEPADATLLEATGLTPQLLVEWKNYFRQAGIVELSVEEAAQDAGWIASGWVNLVARGWMAARWRGVRAVLSREFRTLRSLALRRVLGLSIIKGTRWPHST